MISDEESRVRVAELVAALSLGIDLGFGQPMEHVLRQCLIALKLADRAGPGEESRAVVYYTALLVNVGCHTDAHEQAKWFGDDITLKSRKYAYDMRSVRVAASAMRFLGAGHPALHRFRLGIEFAVSGHREVDGMIDHHAKMTRLLAEQLGLADAVLDSVGAAYERWDGRGWPGSVGGEDIPVPARIAQLAEFAEVAHRVGGVGASVALARERSGKQFDPMLAGLLREDAGNILGAADAIQTWDAVIAAEPALAVMLSEDEFDSRCDPAGLTGRRRGGAQGRRPPGKAARRARRRIDRPRGRGAASCRQGPVDQTDRPAAGDVAQDGGQPHRAHLHQDRRQQPRRREPIRGAARLARRRRKRCWRRVRSIPIGTSAGPCVRRRGQEPR